MYAIVYKSDGFPICQQVAGVSPDPVVTWNTEDAAKAFIANRAAVARTSARAAHRRGNGQDRAGHGLRGRVDDVRTVPQLAQAEEFPAALHAAHAQQQFRSASRATKFRFSEFTISTGAAALVVEEARVASASSAR